jgi:hypothetical protein
MKKMKAPYPMEISIGGTETPITKFDSQIVAAATPTPFARRELGNTSAGMTQAKGPYDTPYVRTIEIWYVVSYTSLILELCIYR